MFGKKTHCGRERTLSFIQRFVEIEAKVIVIDEMNQN